jgi:DNA-binding NtrC family response regulator
VNDRVCPTGVGVSIPTLLQDLDAAARSDVNVLITTERTSGRSAVAQLIHHQSDRGCGPLVTLDCAGALRPENFDRLETARGGTILIDHVQEMTAEMQARLMQFLEADHKSLEVRVIAAADSSLLDKTAGGQFREDLYYRLNLIHLVMPPTSRDQPRIRA